MCAFVMPDAALGAAAWVQKKQAAKKKQPATKQAPADPG